MRLSQKSLYNKSSRITSMSFINETNSDIKDLLISFSNGYEIEIDKITTNNNKSSLYQKINLKEQERIAAREKEAQERREKINAKMQQRKKKSQYQIHNLFQITKHLYKNRIKK